MVCDTIDSTYYLQIFQTQFSQLKVHQFYIPQTKTKMKTWPFLYPFHPEKQH